MRKKLYVVGIGPGSAAGMTLEAVHALRDSEVIIGYTLYCDLVKNSMAEIEREMFGAAQDEKSFENKEFISTGMTQEIQRCRAALEEADKGKVCAIVCSGDAGVYAMAGLVCRLAEKFPEVELQIVPGVSAVLSGAAVLGAPAAHDFAVISLSDLLTPYELIMNRVRLAAEGDFVICLYNPSSRKRKDHLANACAEILKHRSPDTVCGIVRNIGREQQERKILTLAKLKETQVDMLSTVFIGNSRTERIGDRMVTPRGYEDKYETD